MHDSPTIAPPAPRPAPPSWWQRAAGAWAVGLVLAGPMVAEEPTVHGAPAAFDLGAEQTETLRIEAGTLLRQRASVRAPALQRIDVDAELAVLDRRDGWVMVRFDDLTGWVAIGTMVESDPVADGAALPAAPSPEPAPSRRWRVPVPERRSTAPDPERVASVIARLGPGRRQIDAGPYTLWTDADRPNLVERLVQIATQVDTAFAERYGVTPSPADNEVIVLFADPRAYRSEADRQAGIAGIGARGHASGGIAVLAIDGPPDHIARILIHELTHLAVRRSVGRELLPLWIEEGLAEDLSYGRITNKGRLQAERLGHSPSDRQTFAEDGRIGIQQRFVGPTAGLTSIRRVRGTGDLPPLSFITGLSFDEFVQSENRALHYAMAGFFVRYLSSAAEPAVRAGWRRFLGSLADGAAADQATLLEALGQDWPALEEGFEAALKQWLKRITFGA